MAIVSKTAPKGVDAVIDAIQQYIYPNLLGAGWTDYECYPRANKNIKGTNIIPEVSTDIKNYIEVLFDDTKNATSFFTVSDIVNFNEDEQLIVQDVSLIFQVNLPKLFPAVTDHRADEEMHMQILQLLNENDELFVNVNGYVQTPGRVYDQLRLGNYARGNTPLDDISEFHVVRFDFQVTYDAGECDVVFTPTCEPVSVSVNGEAFEIYGAGTSQNIEIVDTNNDPQGVKIGTNKIQVPAAVAADAGLELNGDPLDSIVPGTTKTVTIQEENGDPVFITEVSDSPTAFLGTIPNSIVPTITPNRPALNQTVQAYVHDEKWHKDNGTFDIAYPTTPKVQQTELDDSEKILFDDSAITGITQHLFRFVGQLGGYYDPNDDNYYDIDGNLSDRNTEFLTNSGNYYIIDRLTWLGWNGIRSGSSSVPIILGIMPVTRGAFSDFYLPPISFFSQLTRPDLNLPLYLSARPPFDIQLNLWSCTYYAGTTTSAWFFGSTGGIQPTNDSGSRAQSYVRVHNWGTDDSI